jgi:hypothetical protein
MLPPSFVRETVTQGLQDAELAAAADGAWDVENFGEDAGPHRQFSPGHPVSAHS